MLCPSFILLCDFRCVFVQCSGWADYNVWDCGYWQKQNWNVISFGWMFICLFTAHKTHTIGSHVDFETVSFRFSFLFFRSDNLFFRCAKKICECYFLIAHRLSTFDVTVELNKIYSCIATIQYLSKHCGRSHDAKPIDSIAIQPNMFVYICHWTTDDFTIDLTIKCNKIDSFDPTRPIKTTQLNYFTCIEDKRFSNAKQWNNKCQSFQSEG